MDRDTKIQAADVIASQINAAIVRSNMNDDEKGILAGSIARLLQLTAEISAAAPSIYKCILTLLDKKKKKYSQILNIGFSPIGLGGTTLDFNHLVVTLHGDWDIRYDVMSGVFYITYNYSTYATDKLLKAGFTLEEE